MVKLLYSVGDVIFLIAQFNTEKEAISWKTYLTDTMKEYNENELKIEKE